MANDKIVIKGAREHNLKNIDLTLPREKFIVMTGLSGSGKSSLAFDTIYADGQRRYVESLSSYARMFLGRMDKPDVDEITGLSPAISIDQKTTSHNPRSTVGTVTEIYDYLRLLYARVGVPHCPVCGRVISQQTVDEMDTEMESMEGDIEFKDVTFRYGNRTPALDHISFTIPQGKKVALVGSSGSGKSTITKLLLKYYEPESGTISVNGVDLDEYSNASVRRCISYVPQNVELFSKTIFENIRISRPEATLDQVREAAKKADAHEFIRRLPLQYNTYLEEAGNGLSGGEKQRIALARAFLKDSSLYIFDESTSSLDFGTENTIFDMIYNQLADRSMLIVAHRLSTIRDCDLILVMDHGQIVERGTHDELLAKQGKYYELWNLQQGIFRRKKEEPAPVAPAAVVEDDDDGEAMTY